MGNIFQRSYARDSEAVEMVVQPVHSVLYSHMEVIKRVALRDLEPSPDWRFGMKKSAFELKDVFKRPPSRNSQFLDDRPFAHHMLDSYRPCFRADDFFILIGF